ncbi:aliphatic sulfonates family ABC transporter, periplasmic ligand-binding protein [Ancylobacter novellus DSM 506]|uniref:Putative aliphatic sulfonates-binding protein n=1 Tax=Ancylobacter novellus (strain ATCC 8093 / DSM 506 / JCM 20403 / CCM 1077 / IAM 12100 / NBRC 12443 / NCIMB 10456) TaxID=639283 RepID=D7A639_ANCN5|nr:sulfonate ABC transporter substrate-binding protein [Ancylobacter novellus]ADH88189.1 aliphatic sulfonates family ABC transporter, periplasmic ligand-binding protein [Ancylobacter novellus DSM 506]
MTSITRRTALAGAAGLALGSRAGLASETQVRVGYQKYGTLVLLKGRGILEKKLEPLGVKVKWAEFAAGPQMLEALNAGAIDIGQTGEAPPIFAQAASDNLLYLANEPPAPKGEAILVPKDSPITSVADLKGKTVGLNKGSNVHFLLVKALEKAGLAYTDITTKFLPPADARAAFEKGALDAWAIWDPFQASAELAIGARVLTTAEGIVPNYQFYLGSRKFANANPAVIEALIASIRETNDWIQTDPAAAVADLAPITGIPAPVLSLAVGRQSFGVAPLSPKVIADQQLVADTFFSLGLLPKKIVVADAVLAARL